MTRSTTGRRETRTKRILYAVGGTGAFLVFALPLAWALLRSVQPGDVIVAAPDPATFFHFTGANFAALVTGPGNLIRSVGNSLVVALSTAALTTVLATAAGYGFARFRFRSAPVLLALVVASMMVPFQAILTPLYLQMNLMRLTDSLFGLVLFNTTVNLPFGILVMRNAFATVPGELEDSAHIDGAGAFRIVTSVLRPLILPGAATVALYAFLAAWTEFLGALTFLTDRNLYTIPVALVNLQQGSYGQIDYGLLAAGAVIAMIPCVVLYVALQRFYVAGLASGAVKG
jgi:multiple sugar transport system permease protein